ncbi:MAG TPA: fibronectin type III domain-containing protein, partial [Thermoanaerobaculales bacterium]|nr:fibronectin type III domain-containing protein [Thermoanaerobaculales bacterium]
TDATSYEYCIDTSNNGACNASWISVGGATGAPLSGLSAATSYFWQVRAVNGQGDTEANGGAWWTFTTQPLPGAFSKTAPANGATGLPTSPTLSWAVSADATSYEYCVDTSNNSACDGSWTTTGSGTSAGLSGLGYATTYYWQVRAVNAQGSTQANGGAWWAFTTEVPMPGAFNKLTPADGATGQLTTLTLSWGASADVGYYEYCIDTADNGVCDGSWIQSGVVTSVQVTDLSEWTGYFWQVRAINGQGSTDADGGAWWWFVTTPYLFGDGFESGDTSPWTTTVP